MGAAPTTSGWLVGRLWSAMFSRCSRAGSSAGSTLTRRNDSTRCAAATPGTSPANVGAWRASASSMARHRDHGDVDASLVALAERYALPGQALAQLRELH